MEKFGISEEQLKDLSETALSGGAEMLWRTQQAWISKQQEEIVEAFAEEKRKQDAIPVGDPRCDKDSQLWAAVRASHEDRKAAQLERLENARGVQAPIWQDISGLHRNEYAMHPGERAGRIRKLLRGVERVARAELRAEETRCGGDWRTLNALLDVDDPSERDGRCFAWDPLRSVCYYFGIAKTKLGAYAWEIWGLSAPQLVDRVKCETVRGKIREELKAFLLKHYGENKDDGIDEVWDALRTVRKGISQRTSLAARLGFSSYSRYFRACVLCYGIEPVELEREVLEEVMRTNEEPGAVVKQEDGQRSEVTSQRSEDEVGVEETARSSGNELSEVDVARSA